MDRDQLVAGSQHHRGAQDMAVGQALEVDVTELELIVTVERVAQPAGSERKLADDPAISRIRDELGAEWSSKIIRDR